MSDRPTVIFLKNVITSYFRDMILESISKIRFWFKVEAGLRFKPEEYITYFEDLKRDSNKEIGPKDIFEFASIVVRRWRQSYPPAY